MTRNIKKRCNESYLYQGLVYICVNKTKTQEIYLLKWDWHVLKRTFKTFFLFCVTC